MQEGHPISYLSKALRPKSRDLSTYERIHGYSDCCAAMAPGKENFSYTMTTKVFPNSMCKGFIQLGSTKCSQGSWVFSTR
jgi:hypothetical protein